MGNKQSSKKLEPDQICDLLKNTNFTRKEVKAWYKRFLEDCPSGKLSFDQFKKTYNDLFPSGYADKFASHVYRSFDTNKDGEIDFTEFLCSLSVTSRGSVEDKLRWAFSIYDIDANGFISRPEMHEIVQAMSKMLRITSDSESKTEDDPDPLKTRLEVVFSKMDANKDGNLSLEEFLDGVKKDPSLVHLLQCSPSSARW